MADLNVLPAEQQFMNTMGVVSGQLNNMTGKIVDAYGNVVQTAVKDWTKDAKKAGNIVLEGAIDGLKAQINQGIDGLEFDPVVTTILKKVSGVTCDLLKGSAGELLTKVAERTQAVAGQLVDSIGNFAKKVFSGLCDFLSGEKSKDTLGNIVKEGFNEAKTTFLDNCKDNLVGLKEDATKNINAVTSGAKKNIVEGTKEVTNEVVGKFTKKIVGEKAEMTENVTKTRG